MLLILAAMHHRSTDTDSVILKVMTIANVTTRGNLDIVDGYVERLYDVAYVVPDSMLYAIFVVFAREWYEVLFSDDC